ncbi:MAG: hypothetical protein LUC26_01915 [Prevotella sp.]|nr:hypothetical protein [Prevotella sp.]
MKKIVSQDACLLYGLPGVAILVISLIAALFVSSDFGGNTFVCAVVFIACNVLLWLVYLLVFQYLPQDILKLIHPRRDADVEEETETEPIEIQPVPQLTNEEYNSYCTEYEQRKNEEQEKLIAVIIDYVNRVMAPFVAEEDLPKLGHEICAWCRDAAYSPTAVPLKYVPIYKDRLKTIDFKHFIWNIGERLGADNGYSGWARARFIKRLFPDALHDAEVVSLQRSLTADPDKGHIKLDRPDYRSYDFHN